MEDLIHEEVELITDLISKTNGEPFDCLHAFNFPIMNVLWRLLTGEKFDYESES